MQKRLIVELASGIARFRAVSEQPFLSTHDAHCVGGERCSLLAFPPGQPHFFHSAPIFAGAPSDARQFPGR
jgi:hypothetical protein